MKRNRTQPPEGVVSRNFIQSENKFEFGPLLILKSTETKGTPQAKLNRDVIRITNNGKYQLHIDFVLRSVADHPPAKDAPLNPFSFEPEFLDLDIDET